MSEMTTIARPYAKAAFEYAVEHKAIQSWQEMLSFSAQVAANEQVQQLLTGSVADDKLADIFVQLCGEQIDQNGQNFIRVLAENKRLTALAEILMLFNQYKAEFEKEVDVDVTSAVELSEQQKQELSVSLEKRLTRKVKLNCSVDPVLIAGVVIKTGDTVIDGSVRSKLNRLTDALQA
ncbi:F0F1 ATP synthase subunit delta [Neptunicella sp. SCSIO 80796]|uniref:F0F1 ATP synthase subunit delta n=1 Tax=Neptunicella plasticusilytica TaxID=3117012 RepID=UPI003A4D457B